MSNAACTGAVVCHAWLGDGGIGGGFGGGGHDHVDVRMVKWLDYGGMVTTVSHSLHCDVHYY